MDISSRIEAYTRKGFMPESKFGQNFLCDGDIIDRIISLCDIGKGDKVLEIGPGLGSLSFPLASLTDNLTVVEIDKRLASFLKDDLELNALIINEDFLKLKDYCAEDFNVVVSNLPYYVMTDIMKKLFAQCVNARKMVFMVEQDALARITARPGTKQYGPLAVLCSIYGGLKVEFTVQRQCFYPSPNTTSCVISLAKGQQTLSEDIVRFIDRCFANRRKKLVNNVKEARTALSALGLNEQIRAEQLEPDVFIKLYNAII